MLLGLFYIIDSGAQMTLTIAYSLTHSRSASVLILGLPLTLTVLPSSFLVSLSLSRWFHLLLSVSLWQCFISSHYRSHSNPHDASSRRPHSFRRSLGITLTLGSLALSISLWRTLSVFCWSCSQLQLSMAATRLADFGSCWCGIFHVTVLGFLIRFHLV